MSFSLLPFIINFDRSLEADLYLSCLSQISMTVIFAPYINKSLFGKSIKTASSFPVDDVPYGISGLFLIHFPDAMKETGWLNKL